MASKLSGTAFEGKPCQMMQDANNQELVTAVVMIMLLVSNMLNQELVMVTGNCDYVSC